MINKIAKSIDDALSVVRDGSTVLIGGFGDIGVPMGLVEALARHGAKNLTLVSNNCGSGEKGLSLLFKHRLVPKVIASFPSQPGNHHFLASYNEGNVTVELTPQGTLAERLRAGGAGIGGFFPPTAYGTELAAGKETRVLNGRNCVFEEAIIGDFALVAAHTADRYGNMRYRLASRNFNPVMAMAGRYTIAEVKTIAAVGELGPDDIHTPGVFVDQVVERAA